MVLELALPSEAWCFSAGRWFVWSWLTASSRRQQNLSKNAVCLGFQTRRYRESFGVVLERVRPSEAWCFPAGRLFFRSCFTASSRRQQNLSKNAVFLRFQTRRREFFGVVLELARPSEAWCFPAGRWFFRSCFTASSRRQQNLSKNQQSRKTNRKSVTYCNCNWDLGSLCCLTFTIYLNYSKINKTWCWLVGSLK